MSGYSAIDKSDWAPGTRYFTQITDDNIAGNLYIATLLSLCYTVCIFGVRFIVKYGMYGIDDWALLVSTVLAIGQYVAILAGLGEGLGKASTLLSAEHIQTIQKLSAAHVFLFFLSHAAAKVSIALLTQRLFANGRRRNIWVCWGLVGTGVFYAIFCVLTFAIECPDPGFISSKFNLCPDRYLRWQLVTAIDIATEIVLSVLPCVLLLEVQIKRADKALVMFVFSFRLLDIVFSALNLRSVSQHLQTTDMSLSMVNPAIWTQTELLWSIIAASVPCLKTFMRPFDKIDEDTWRSNNDMYASQRSGGGGQRSWRDPREKDGAMPLHDIRGHKRGAIQVNATGNDRAGTVGMGHVRPDQVRHDVVITSHAAADGQSMEDGRRSWGSQDRIIKAQTHWEVRSHPKDPYPI